MKRLILAAATMFLLTAGVALAQDPLNTTAPGPTMEQKPGQTNNDLPNPGHPIPTPTNAQAKPVTDQTATAPTSTTDTSSTSSTTTGTTTGTTTSTTTGTSTGTTTGSATDSYGSTTGTSTSADATATGKSDSLPKTGSEMPLVALIGLAALAGAFALRASRRNA